MSVVVILAMAVILVLAAAVIVFVAYPYRGHEPPSFPRRTRGPARPDEPSVDADPRAPTERPVQGQGQQDEGREQQPSR